jgi:hypothetical protein
MKLTFLPLLSFNTSLQDAYQTMQSHLKAAVVRTDPVDYSLIRAPELYSGMANNFSIIGDLPDKFPMHKISNQDIIQRGLDVIDPTKTESKFEQLLDLVNKKYAVLDSGSGIIRVITRHEGLADQFNSSPTLCYCDNEDYMHSYPPPNKSHGDKCYCGHMISCR